MRTRERVKLLDGGVPGRIVKTGHRRGLPVAFVIFDNGAKEWLRTAFLQHINY